MVQIRFAPAAGQDAAADEEDDGSGHDMQSAQQVQASDEKVRFASDDGQAPASDDSLAGAGMVAVEATLPAASGWLRT